MGTQKSVGRNYKMLIEILHSYIRNISNYVITSAYYFYKLKNHVQHFFWTRARSENAHVQVRLQVDNSLNNVFSFEDVSWSEN